MWKENKQECVQSELLHNGGMEAAHKWDHAEREGGTEEEKRPLSQDRRGERWSWVRKKK